ncbi:hypothetical protein D3C76_1247010 [compost metagenome]
MHAGFGHTADDLVAGRVDHLKVVGIVCRLLATVDKAAVLTLKKPAHLGQKADVAHGTNLKEKQSLDPSAAYPRRLD